MNRNVHYVLTFSALFFFGLVAANRPVLNQPTQVEERQCDVDKGKLSCTYKYTENRITTNLDVQYKFN